MYKSYASTFAAYLLRELQEPQNILRIILFGSAARGEAKKNSDIDIFIELKKNDKKFEQKISDTLEKFYQSREALIFKNKGLNNHFHIIAGILDEWKELKKSIEDNGIILYSYYISSYSQGKKYLIINWDKIGKNRGAFLNKIYGFRVKDKKYIGLIERYKGKKIGKSSILVPIEHREEFLSLIKQYKVNAKILEVYSSS